jgi:hypothetical protein
VGVPWSRSRKGFEAELHLSVGDMDDGEELAGTAAAAVESEADTSESKQEEVGGRPRRERKQVERIRSSELRLVTKKTRTGAGPVKAKTQRKTASGSDEDEDEDEDLDVPLAARGSKPAEPVKRRKKAAQKVGSAGPKKKRRTSEETDEGPDPDSEEAAQIRSSLMDLCDELGEDTLVETTPKVLRRKLERKLKRDEGDLDGWKKLILEWYNRADDIKTALRKLLQKINDDDDESIEWTPKAIRRELEKRLKLDEGELDCWKSQIDRWTLRLNEETSLSPVRSPKTKSFSRRPDADSGAVDETQKSPATSQHGAQHNVTSSMKSTGANRMLESGLAGRMKDAPDEDAASSVQSVDPSKHDKEGDVPKNEDQMKPDVSMNADEKVEGSPKGSDTDTLKSEGAGKVRGSTEERKEEKEQEGRRDRKSDAHARDKTKGERNDVRSSKRESRDNEHRRNSKDTETEGGRLKEGKEKEARSGEHKDRDIQRGDKRDKERERGDKPRKDGKEILGRVEGKKDHGAEPSVQAVPSSRPNDVGGSKWAKVKEAVWAPLDNSFSKLLERRASIGKEGPSLLQVQPCYKPIQREASEANQYRACPLQDLDELQKLAVEAEQRRAAEEKIRAQREQEAAQRRRADEEKQKVEAKIREAAKKPLPSFKGLMKKNSASPPTSVDLSTDLTSAHSDYPSGPLGSSALKRSPAIVLRSDDKHVAAHAAAEGNGDDKKGKPTRNVGFSPKVEQRMYIVDDDDPKELTPNTKSLRQYVGATHIGDILKEWQILSQEQVAGYSPSLFLSLFSPRGCLVRICIRRVLSLAHSPLFCAEAQDWG